ncbi:uncharacterized protein LOC117290118 [Asterias rubens]|uniref:uncharacterized protein LOC117290118 n=1 Tax=Asterias rubens TaxID=7604 RepID=UPI001455C079|nr:uncharacterized protein LOC117290118 [Asterias rubens]
MSSLCDDDQSTYCTFGSEAEVCMHDESREPCMYYRRYPSGDIYRYCVCGSVGSRLPRLERSCSNRDTDSTTVRMSTDMPSTQPPTVATTMYTREPLASPRVATAPPGGEPLASATIAAIVLGTVLGVLLIAVALGLLCLFRMNRLKCGAGTGVTTTDAGIEMAQNGNGSVRGQGSVVSTNAYEDTSTRRDGTSEHAYKSLHLDHEQSHYYSRIPEKSGTPGVRTTQEEVTPSAPPIEGHDQNTEAQEGHEYFVLEREPSKRSSETENSNHDYFVLEKDQGEGGEDGDTPGKEVDSAIVSKPAATHEGYDRIKLSPQHNTAENTYSHLKPNPVKEVEYDHLARPGHT